MQIKYQHLYEDIGAYRTYFEGYEKYPTTPKIVSLDKKKTPITRSLYLFY